jgi:hypothetical protein
MDDFMDNEQYTFSAGHRGLWLHFTRRYYILKPSSWTTFSFDHVDV